MVRAMRVNVEAFGSTSPLSILLKVPRAKPASLQSRSWLYPFDALIRAMWLPRSLRKSFFLKFSRSSIVLSIGRGPVRDDACRQVFYRQAECKQVLQDTDDTCCYTNVRGFGPLGAFLEIRSRC
jgi:hypothetical protein